MLPAVNSATTQCLRTLDVASSSLSSLSSSSLSSLSLSLASSLTRVHPLARNGGVRRFPPAAPPSTSSVPRRAASSSVASSSSSASASSSSSSPSSSLSSSSPASGVPIVRTSRLSTATARQRVSSENDEPAQGQAAAAAMATKKREKKHSLDVVHDDDDGDDDEHTRLGELLLSSLAPPGDAAVEHAAHHRTVRTSHDLLARGLGADLAEDAKHRVRPMRGEAQAWRIDPLSVFSDASFLHRHLGPRDHDVATMLDTLNVRTLDELCERVMPNSIRMRRPLDMPGERSEHSVLSELRELSMENRVRRSMIGQGYYGTFMPPVIKRAVLENPAWYTSYTPYQPEISQGRLEALLNFQTMITDLTGCAVANASLLDEGTAAAEALQLCLALRPKGSRTVVVEASCHPQTIEVVRTRCAAQSVRLEVVRSASAVDWSLEPFAGAAAVLVQYPASTGELASDYADTAERAHAAGAKVVVACDLLSLTMLTPPAAWGADLCIGSSQRFGVPMGYGGPHAAFIGCASEKLIRRLPGRIVGVSIDAEGEQAYRLTLQTREQHIKREKATSNICTAQALLAMLAAFYAQYHGPAGLRNIAARVHANAVTLAEGARRLGHEVLNGDAFFDTVNIRIRRAGTGEVAPMSARECADRAAHAGYLVRTLPADNSVCISIDETTTEDDIEALLRALLPRSLDDRPPPFVAQPHRLLYTQGACKIPTPLRRSFQSSPYLQHPVFNLYHSETQMARYLKQLESKDYSLVTGAVPLGSCTMKLNAAVEMLALSWSEFTDVHPFAPAADARGYRRLFQQLESMLCELTGMDYVSLQPNAGSQGEFAGLRAIRRYHENRGERRREYIIIPVSAHGTNAASTVLNGFKVMPLKCLTDGRLDLSDLRGILAQHGDEIAGIMVTYPSTFGVFEETITEVCDMVHEVGGQVYLDGANMNAQMGLARPGDVGADVCHLNLHKTCAIPHGGGGPGVGPIGVKAHLMPFVPGDSLVRDSGAVSSSMHGSALVLPITWAYLKLSGGEGLRRSSQIAVLNANYARARLENHYHVKWTNPAGMVAHEFIVSVENTAGVTATDISKRLMDYGFHAPTENWPVLEALMIEPTESETKEEIDRFCDALIAIRGEIAEIERGEQPRDNNVIKNAPHTHRVITSDRWDRPYSREKAVYPMPEQRHNKFWPATSRIDQATGDRHLMCHCPTGSITDWLEEQRAPKSTAAQQQKSAAVEGSV